MKSQLCIRMHAAPNTSTYLFHHLSDNKPHSPFFYENTFRQRQWQTKFPDGARYQSFSLQGGVHPSRLISCGAAPFSLVDRKKITILDLVIVDRPIISVASCADELRLRKSGGTSVEDEALGGWASVMWRVDLAC
jgi:hypothetical protein